MLNKLLPHVIVAAVVGTASLGMEAILPRAAMALSFNFSFINESHGGGTVTGIVEGLTDNTTSAATSIRVLSNTAGFGIGEYVGNPSANSWTVLDGGIQAYRFLSFGSRNFLPAVTDSSLIFDSPAAAGLSNNPNSVTANSLASLTFTAVPVPTPALLPGLVGMSLAFLRKRQANAV
jgi:hypothetical protein